MPAAKGKVDLIQYGKVAEELTPLPANWPQGKDIMKMLKMSETSAEQEEYWQVCARWALLQKYGLIETQNDSYIVQEDGSRKLVLSAEQRKQIQTNWQDVLNSKSKHGELSEFCDTSCSNQRPLQWSLMDCGPAAQFHLHAHPNIELVYCLRGELHEVRMDGSPYEVSSDGKGPSLVDCKRSWTFATLHQGCWLVNEVGSIHKSFTATSGEGCALLVLWGGSHADIVDGEEPTAVDVHAAVDQMDSKLKCDCGKSATMIQETFIPESEKCLAMA